MGRAADEVHPPTADFDEEQHVQSLEPNRVDGKEIDGRPVRRRKIATSWRSTTISNSLNSRERSRRTTSCSTRWSTTYQADRSTTPKEESQEAPAILRKIEFLHP